MVDIVVFDKKEFGNGILLKFSLDVWLYLLECLLEIVELLVTSVSSIFSFFVYRIELFVYFRVFIFKKYKVLLEYLLIVVFFGF